MQKAKERVKPETNKASESLSLPAHKVVNIVHTWVQDEARQIPHFAGAYLWGGITALAPDAPFLLYRDVDVVVVLSRDVPDEESEYLYGGLSIEVIWKGLDEHQSVEEALANPSAGPNLATTQILADPTGILTPLQQRVAAAYPRRKWIVERCAAEKRDADEALTNMRKAVTSAERLDSIRALLGALSGLLAVAQLERPTTRRTLALLGELLDAEGRRDLHEQTLIVMGSAAMTCDDVLALLDLVMHAYDRAVEVYRTHIPYGFALRAHLRPYYVEGALEMVAEGDHREAVFWITCLDTAFLALENDAPADEMPFYAARFQAFYASLGLDDDVSWPDRVALAGKVTREVFEIADGIVARQPE